MLDNAIQTVHQEALQDYLKLVKIYADSRYSWTKVASQWNDLLEGLNKQYPTAESRKLPGLMFNYKVG